MMSRSASRWFVAALFAVSAAIPVVGAGAANAAPTDGPVYGPGNHYGYGHGHGGYGYGHYRHHHHPNCNNDPESPYAMSPECPGTYNSEYSPYGYGWPDD